MHGAQHKGLLNVTGHDCTYFVESTPLRVFIGSFYHFTDMLQISIKKFNASNICFDKLIYRVFTLAIFRRRHLLVGSPIGKKTLIFTFDGKIEYIILPMLILFLDMWQNTYGWMPSL